MLSMIAELDSESLAFCSLLAGPPGALLTWFLTARPLAEKRSALSIECDDLQNELWRLRKLSDRAGVVRPVDRSHQEVLDRTAEAIADCRRRLAEIGGGLGAEDIGKIEVAMKALDGVPKETSAPDSSG